MKDDKLEKEFGEYFKGVNTPDGITADAKKRVKKENTFLPKFAKFASIAASFVLVAAVALTVVLKTDVKEGQSTLPSTPDQSSSDGVLIGDKYLYLYSEDGLAQKKENPYSVTSLNPALKFMERIALADNADVKNCTSLYNGETLYMVKADLDVLSGFSRDETEMIAEFTEENYVLREVAEYYAGEKGTYYGAEYYLTETVGGNGEPEFKLIVINDGIKYYFDVKSSDKTAYGKYLNLVLSENF